MKAQAMKHLAFSCPAALAMAFVIVAPAAGDPLSIPNGPWVMPSQNEPLSAIRDYGQLVAILENCVQASQGAATLIFSPFRAKGSGRAIPIVTIGDGPRGILIVANQHGLEYVVSNSAVEIVRALTNNSREARFIREQLTVTVLPRLNIDGFDATTTGDPWRENVDPDVCSTESCPAFYTPGRGYDVNRYHPFLRADPLDDPTQGPLGVGDGGNPVPEALAARRAYDDAGGPEVVEVVIDLHQQVTFLDEEGDMVTGSTFWPSALGTANALGIRPQFDQVVFRSKQVIAAFLGRLSSYGYVNFSRYPGTTPPGISRNAYGLLGSASVLIELRHAGQKANGYTAKTGAGAVLAVIEALADRSLYDTDIAPAEALVRTPDFLTLLLKCLAVREYTLENLNFCLEKLGLEPVDTLPPFPPPFEAGEGEDADAPATDGLLAEELARLEHE